MNSEPDISRLVERSEMADFRERLRDALDRLDRDPSIEDLETFIRRAEIEFVRAELISRLEAKKRIMQAELIGAIIQRVPTPEAWAAMGGIKRNVFRLEWRGKKISLALAAKMLGLSTSYKLNAQSHLAMGRRIYGAEKWDTREKEKKTLDEKARSELIATITHAVPTPEAWVAIRGCKKNAFRIEWKGEKISLTVAARFLGMKGNPVSHTKVHLAMGRLIFGEEHECLQE